MKHLVPTPGTCRLMFENGFPQESFWGFLFNAKGTAFSQGSLEACQGLAISGKDTAVAAPFLQTILDELPDAYGGGLLTMVKHGDLYRFDYVAINGEFYFGYEHWLLENPAESAALLWLKLQEATR